MTTIYFTTNIYIFLIIITLPTIIGAAPTANIYCLLGTVLSTLYVLSHLITNPMRQILSICPFFSHEEKNKAQRGNLPMISRLVGADANQGSLTPGFSLFITTILTSLHLCYTDITIPTFLANPLKVQKQQCHQGDFRTLKVPKSRQNNHGAVEEIC